MRVTRPNLLSWYDANPDLNALPRARQDCRTGSLITFPGDTFSFYLNEVLATQRNNLSGVAMVPVLPTGAAYPAQNGVTIDPVRNGETSVYGELICPNLPPGLYRYKLEFGSAVLLSTVIELADEATVRASSIQIRYRNPVSLQGVRYPWIDPNFYQQVRLRALLIATPPQAEQTLYREVTTGITVPYATAFDQLLTFQVPFTDSDILGGLAVALLHETLFINNRPVTAKDLLNLTAGRNALSTGTFSVIDNSVADSLLPT